MVFFVAACGGFPSHWNTNLMSQRSCPWLRPGDDGCTYDCLLSMTRQTCCGIACGAFCRSHENATFALAQTIQRRSLIPLRRAFCVVKLRLQALFEAGRPKPSLPKLRLRSLKSYSRGWVDDGCLCDGRRRRLGALAADAQARW